MSGDPLYHDFRSYLKDRLGGEVRKVSVDAGFSCPNRDGTVGAGGCAYCVNSAFVPGNADLRLPLREQLARGVAAARRRAPAAKFLAYFQPNSNTYAPLETLRKKYEEALAMDGIIGLCIGTRPDCLGPGVPEYLSELARRYFVQLELGLQTANDATLAAINRGHTVADFRAAAARCRGLGFDLCAHVIVGLPGEGGEDFLRTARLVAECGVNGIKIHNLHVVRGSGLESQYRAGRIEVLSLPAYAEAVADMLEVLPWRINIQRLHGTAPAGQLLAPDWCRDGNAVRREITLVLHERGSRQGCRSEGSKTQT